MEKKCLECDTTLKGKQEKYCCPRCRQKHWKKNEGRESCNRQNREYHRKKCRENWNEKKCIVCENLFLPLLSHKTQQRYCSKKCSDSVVRRISRQNNRAKKLYNSKDSLSVQDWLDVLERDNKQCQVCLSTLNIELDHIVPLSRGGVNKKENIRVSCRKCNRHNDTTFKRSVAL